MAKQFSVFLILFMINFISFRANPKCLGNIVRFELDVMRKIEKGLRRDATKRELAESRKGRGLK